MAAHLEGKTATVLNESGLAQKNGAVQSHIRIAADPATELSARIAERSTDVVIGADIVVTAGPDRSPPWTSGRTRAVVNDDVRPTVAFSRNSNIDMSHRADGRAPCSGPPATTIELIDANRLATARDGRRDLHQPAPARLRPPEGLAAGQRSTPCERAIELNGVSVANNLEALQWGRLAAHDMDAVEAARHRRRGGVGDLRCCSRASRSAETLDELDRPPPPFLADYQDADVGRPLRRRPCAAWSPPSSSGRPGHDRARSRPWPATCSS